MKKLALGLLPFLLNGCSPTQSHATGAASTVELMPYQDLLFCGSVDEFAKASAAVYGPLKNAWDQVVGADNNEYCRISVSFDKNGVINGYKVIQCDSIESLPDVIELASPIIVPDNACIFERIQRIKYTINGEDKSSS